MKENDICLSFDDALKCQYDVAIPVLNERNISAFFFVYSSAFSDNPDYLEIYRLFRTKCFQNVTDFYQKFFEIVKNINKNNYIIEKKIFFSINYLKNFPFYTEDDKWFRYLRDNYLGNIQYNLIMNQMMLEKQFDISSAKDNLWMNENNLKEIHYQGHVIGLHSYSHPTQMSKLSYEDQMAEYQKNINHLKQTLNFEDIKAMSHPCGNYNKDTLMILHKLGIKIGFRSNLGIKTIKSSLEIPREDHSNIYKKIRK